VSQGSKEWEAHRTAEAHNIGQLEKTPHETELFADLRTPEERHQRSRRPLNDRAESVHLALHQAPSGARQTLSHAPGTRVWKVRRGKCIADVQIRELGERRCQGGLAP
jgi:hypothetical protein